MFPITVLKVSEDRESGKLVSIDLSDVLYMSVDGAKLVFFTEEGRYYQLTSIQEYEKHLKHHQFEKLDRPYLVNMKKVRKFDPDLRLVYFQEDICPDHQSKAQHVTVAQTKVNLVKKYLPASN